MKRKKKGFTLIELLAVIVILLIILSIATPPLLDLLTSSRSKTYDLTVEAIKNAARVYFADHPENHVEGEEFFVSISELCTNEYLSCPVYNPDTEAEMNGYVRITKNGNTFDYEYVEGAVPLPDYIASEGVNRPRLISGLTAVRWDGSSWVTVTDPENDTSWYNYANKEWANATTADGSMWVWIPRYAYQIASGYHTATAGTIDIKLLKGITDTASDNTTASTTPTYSGSSQTNYIVHPAFTFGATKLTGIWVAKFEMSGTTSSLDSKPGVASLRSISVGDMFTASRNMETNSKYGWELASGLNADQTFATNTNNVDTHMMRNIEWGSVVYLALSTFGKNAEITVNNSTDFYTGGGAGTAYVTNTNQSTTGNVYGIYDMSGGAEEFVAANYNNTAGSSGLTPANINDKYIDRYTSYDATKYGDAMYETSSSSNSVNSSWYGDYSYMIDASFPWLKRDGSYVYGGNYGACSFSSTGGYSSSAYSWRTTLLVGTGY